jgi:hypothetical protein
MHQFGFCPERGTMSGAKGKTTEFMLSGSIVPKTNQRVAGTATPSA